MFRKFLVAAMIAFSMSSFAVQIESKGLSEAQIAEIKAIAAKKVAENEVEKVTPGLSSGSISASAALAATWGQQAASAAEGFARAMGIAARELNVTINDFLKSPAGILTAVVIIWKVAGASILGVIYGTVFVTVGLIMVRVIYKRLFTGKHEKVEYSYFGGLFKGTKMVRVPKSFKDLENDGEWLVFWVMLALTAGVLLVGGTFF